jgi:hypothetical protein
VKFAIPTFWKVLGTSFERTVSKLKVDVERNLTIPELLKRTVYGGRKFCGGREVRWLS